MTAPNLSMAWAGALMHELAAAGVHHVVVSPGSRSAPLALAAASCAILRDHSVLDERSAAFFALGLAKTLREPVALVCTSGTAAANYLPAAVEAHYARASLLLLTADRPPERRDCGAPQTIEQPGLYGRYVRYAVDVPSPELSDVAFRTLRALVCRALAASQGLQPGPVHLNLPFREPLDPTTVPDEMHALEKLPALAREGRSSDPFIHVSRSPEIVPAAAQVDALAEWLGGEERGWIVVGPLDADDALAAALVRLTDAVGWPVFVDALSGLRAGTHAPALAVDAYDAVLRAKPLLDPRPPRRVLRLGALPTSKPLWEQLEAHPEIDLRVVDPVSWSEPSAFARELLRVDPRLLAEALLPRLRPRAPSAFGKRWIEAGRRARRAIDARLDAEHRLTEPAASADLARALPPGGTLFVASSMPVRDVDLFWPQSGPPVRILANRGANGIDGTLSSALGVSQATAGPFAALVGDLALLHDLGGLVTARATGARGAIVVVDNQGGGIFELLPAASSVPRELFERHLGTPQSVDLRGAVEGLGFEWRDPDSRDEFVEVCRAAVRGSELCFVRLRTDRRENARLHHELHAAAAAALADGSDDA